jgi:tripartite-type tricarboxylate transporter receptor subunit TctC
MPSPHPTRRQFLTASAASAATLSFPAFAAGDIGGGKTITLVVSYPAGGGADAMARLIAPKMAEALGQSVIVDNKPGGSGTIAAGQVARAAPDGTTLLLDASSFAVNPALFQKLPYDNEKSFVPIAVLAQFPNILVCTPSFEAKTVADVLRLARAKQGTIAYASSGNGSAQHLAGALFEQLAKVDLTHVPYRGGGPAMNDVMGGQVPLFFANVASGRSPSPPRHAAAPCPTCRRWQKPACPVTRCSNGTRSWRRPASRPPCVTSSSPPWRARWAMPKCWAACEHWVAICSPAIRRSS